MSSHLPNIFAILWTNSMFVVVAWCLHMHRICEENYHIRICFEPLPNIIENYWNWQFVWTLLVFFLIIFFFCFFFFRLNLKLHQLIFAFQQQIKADIASHATLSFIGMFTQNLLKLAGICIYNQLKYKLYHSVFTSSVEMNIMKA